MHTYVLYLSVNIFVNMQHIIIVALFHTYIINCIALYFMNVFCILHLEVPVTARTNHVSSGWSAYSDQLVVH